MTPPVPAAPVDPDEARRRVLEELAKGEYHRDDGFLSRVLGLLEDWLDSLSGGAGGSSAALIVIMVVIAVVLLGIGLLVARRSGRLRRDTALGVSSRLDADPVLSAEELRRRARAAAGESRHSDAAVLGMRALVRDLQERTLSEVTEGKTAHEAAAEAALAFPALRHRLLRAADVFDTAAYSRHRIDAKSAEDVVRLAEYVAEATPRLLAGEDA
ncbi:DUF4129 domain-containing protein [Brachybacterium endophyticum]|uniref:DUF4129 domain-containing protein n=1 Tax=Brachybacterium endophyticum TaxID=2182385 RepID=A0A2U2RH27_9MICO|nr:DUF4129 domain-containing protein [Brachybacterium endophyticum]PWH05156.1 DUF4129 domain-containing protein [Brachybacterium endophyticum]